MDFRVVGLLGLGVAIAVCLVALVRIGAGQLRRRNGGTVTVGVVKSVEVRYQAAGEGPTMVQRTPVVEFQDASGTIRQFQNAHPVDCPDAGGRVRVWYDPARPTRHPEVVPGGQVGSALGYLAGLVLAGLLLGFVLLTGGQ